MPQKVPNTPTSRSTCLPTYLNPQDAVTYRDPTLEDISNQPQGCRATTRCAHKA